MLPVLFMSLVQLSAPGSLLAEPEPCNGYNTIDMRVCAEIRGINSRNKLRTQIKPRTYKKWDKLTGELCKQAYEPYKEGTIYPLMISKCHNELNELLSEHLDGLGENSR